MLVNARRSGAATVLDLEGRLVTGTGTEELNRAVNEQLAAGEKRIVVNLAAVTRIDSSGLGELVAAVQLADRLGSALRFVKPRRRVHKVLEIARLLPALEMHDTEAEAIAAF